MARCHYAVKYAFQKKARLDLWELQRAFPFLNSTEQAKFNVSYIVLITTLDIFRKLMDFLLIRIRISMAHFLRDIASGNDDGLTL